MDAFGTIVFTGGVVMALGSYFTHVFFFVLERGDKKSMKKSSQRVMDESLRASPMQVVVGGSLF